MSYTKLSKQRGDGAAKGLTALRGMIQSTTVRLRSGLESADDLSDLEAGTLGDIVSKTKEQLTEAVPNEVETVVVNGEEQETSPEATDSQVDAAIDVMKLSGDEAALENFFAGAMSIPSNFDVVGHTGRDVLGERVGNEQFVEQELKSSTELTMNFNVRGQRQGRLAELFFRTTVLPAEAPYAKFELYAPQIVRDRKRAIDKVSAHNYIRLLDAAIDHTLLNMSSTAAVPVHQTVGTDTSGFFMTGYAPEEVTYGEDTFNTAPLALGKRLNLINLSARPGLVAAGLLDNTDTLEASLRVTSIVASITYDHDADGGTTAEEERFVAFNVENLPAMQFISSDNSVGDEVQFSHTGRFAIVNAGTLATDGVSTPFQALAPTYQGDVVLSIGISGNFNLNTGEGHVSATSSIDVVGYIAPNATEMDTSDATLNAIRALDGFDTLVAGGYKIKASRTNMNKRHEGTLLATLPVREAFRVELSEPLLAQLPLGVSNQEKAQEIASQVLVAGSRLRNNNLAITKLISTAAAMEAQAALSNVSDVVMECEGIARHLIRPQYQVETVDFDVAANVQNLKSHERAADVSAALVNRLRLMSTKLWVDSNLESAYQFAADQGNLVKPKLAIGTDPVIAQHLMVTGDTRLVGVRFDYELAYDVDARVKNNIFLAFVSNDHQYLTFGQHLWVTEIVTNLQISRDGRTVRELQVQPRNRHIVTLPVLGQIKCSNLDKVLVNPTNAWTLVSVEAP